MSDPFFDAVNGLVSKHTSIRGAAFTDLDGEHIALSPKSERDVLRVCAAYGGIALRRLGQAEEEAARPPIDRITLEGDQGRFISLRVGREYQLVLTLGGDQPTGSLMADAQAAAKALADQV